MIRFLILCALGLIAAAPGRAQQPSDCGFGFDIDRQSSAFQTLIVDGQEQSGFWLSINRAPADVRRVAKFIGRLQVCLMTPDGLPRTVTRAGSTFELTSPFVTNCTAALLPGNRLLTNVHCYYDPSLVEAGFSVVREARINFNYTSRDDTGTVATYLVSPVELAKAEALDAMVLQILGGDANAGQGGHVPMTMRTDVPPFEELRMIHHPAAAPQQYSTGTCQIHRRQDEIPDDRSPLRHTCESTYGSSGALLFDARTLAVVGLHNQGGLTRTGDSFNGGHKIAMIEAALDLGFTEAAPPSASASDGDRALLEALLLTDLSARLAALEAVVANHPGSRAANEAETMLASLRPDPPRGPGGDDIDETGGETPQPGSLAARMLADSDVQACDRLAGPPSHPDRDSGAMVEKGRPFSAIDGAAAERACRAALAAFPDHPRLLSSLGDALIRLNRTAEAVEAYRRSAEQGDPTGLTSMGFIHSDGRGVPRSHALALEFFRSAAALDYPVAFTGLGLLYRDGNGVPRDYIRAREYLERAAAGGDAIGASILGELYETGRGTAADPDRAADLYVQALRGGTDWLIDTKSRWLPATGRALQVRLRDLGYYDGPLDGAVGPGTRAAMAALRDASM